MGGQRVSVQGALSHRIAWPATLVAKRGVPLRAEHVRYRRVAAEAGVLHCFVLDCSASMLSGERLALAKGLLAALFDQAARERAHVALVCYGNGRADLRFGPAVPRWWNERWLAPLAGGGGTPFALAVDVAAGVLARAARRNAGQQQWLWLLTDGRSSERPARPPGVDEVVVVDFEDGLCLGGCERVAQAWGGVCLGIADLSG